MANRFYIDKKRTGIWIDHKEAFLVTLEEGETNVEHIESNADSNVRAKGGYKAAGTSLAQSVLKEQRTDERRRHQLRDYFQKVIKMSREANDIYIFGPGEAKLELEKEFKKQGSEDRIRAVETSDSMTKNQIVAKVKSYFSVSEERILP